MKTIPNKRMLGGLLGIDLLLGGLVTCIAGGLQPGHKILKLAEPKISDIADSKGMLPCNDIKTNELLNEDGKNTSSLKHTKTVSQSHAKENMRGAACDQILSRSNGSANPHLINGGLNGEIKTAELGFRRYISDGPIDLVLDGESDQLARLKMADDPVISIRGAGVTGDATIAHQVSESADAQDRRLEELLQKFRDKLRLESLDENSETAQEWVPVNYPELAFSILRRNPFMRNLLCSLPWSMSQLLACMEYNTKTKLIKMRYESVIYRMAQLQPLKAEFAYIHAKSTTAICLQSPQDDAKKPVVKILDENLFWDFSENLRLNELIKDLAEYFFDVDSPARIYRGFISDQEDGMFLVTEIDSLKSDKVMVLSKTTLPVDECGPVPFYAIYMDPKLSEKWEPLRNERLAGIENCMEFSDYMLFEENLLKEVKSDWFGDGLLCLTPN